VARSECGRLGGNNVDVNASGGTGPQHGDSEPTGAGEGKATKGKADATAGTVSHADLPPSLRPTPAVGSALAGVVIIGCGEVALLYAGCIAGANATTLVTGVCDVDLTRAQSLAHIVDSAQKRVYDDAPLCVSCTTVAELVSVLPLGRRRVALNLTPTQHHAPVTEELLRAGFHVWSEKPIAPTHTEVRSRLRDRHTHAHTHARTHTHTHTNTHTHTHTHTHPHPHTPRH
jgi:hypothetical protein